MVQVSQRARQGLRFAATPDVLSVAEAEVFARAVARFNVTDDAARFLAEHAAQSQAGQDFLDVFDIGDLRAWDPRALWRQLTPSERLKVPLGKGVSGRVEWIDIKEWAEGGVGPHGSVVGWTGSGKSEHLIAFVCGLAIKHPPEMVQILLGDFKGEAGLGVLLGLPHVKGIVSNLAGSAHKLDRFEAVLRGEMSRRQEILNATGFTSVRDYERARATVRPDLEPLGAFILVLDELPQLLTIRPEMAKLFDEVGRLGRSLWVHIINSGQRAEPGKMQGLMGQQTYAIGLKVKDAAESRAAIGSARAYEDLKRAPAGSAFLVVDGEHTRYRSFYLSGPYVPPKTSARQRRADGAFIDVHRFGAEVAPLPDDIDEDDLPDDTGEQDVIPADAPSVVSLLVERIAATGAGRQMHEVFRLDLEETPFIALDEMAQEFWGRSSWDEFSADAGLVVPYAREDDPFRHAQDLVSMPVGAANVGIVGGLQRGKSTALMTLMATLAISHSPARAQFYGIDYGGGKLAGMAALPHVCGTAGRGQDDKIRRIVAEVERIYRGRVRSWGAEGLDLATFRARKFGAAGGAVPEDGHGDVFVVIDNMKAFQGELLEVHDRVIALAESAVNYGIHVIVTNESWLTIKGTLEAKLSKIELRLAKKNDSELDRAAAETVPTDQPGRGLVQSGKVVNHMLVGVPRLRQFCDLPNEQEANEATAAAIEARWLALGYGRAPELGVLPAEVGYDDLPAAPPGVLKLGIGEREFSTVGVDLRVAPHFYAAASSKSGGTTVLRTLCAAIMETYTPQQARVILIDPSFDLADAVTDEYRATYANTPEQAGLVATELAAVALKRKPPVGLTPQQQKEWRPVRPKLFVIVDDLNLLTVQSTGTSALAPLTSAIEQGQRLDLHVFVGTTSEQWYAKGRLNKVIQAMETGGTGALVMDGQKSEIIIDQVRAAIREPGRGELYYRKLGGQLMQVALPPVRPV